MKLFEFEGKRLLADCGIRVPESCMVTNLSQPPMAYPFVLKAQTLSGGRGKAGGIRICRNDEEFRKNAREIMSLTIKGNPVHGLLAEQVMEIRQEIYLAITQQSSAYPRLIACASGGMEIENLARTDPDRLFTAELDPFSGLSGEQLEKLISFLGLKEGEIRKVIDALQHCFFHNDAVLVEINPLGVVDGGLMALDAKVELDNKAEYRHAALFDTIRQSRDILQNFTEEKDDGTTITFVPLDGTIGLISDGAGTGMLTLDMLYDRGGMVASFCELGGTTPASTMYKAMEYTFSSGKDLKSLLIVLIGGFNRMDDMANGIVSYLKDHEVQVPIITRMVGNMEEVGLKIMEEAGLKTYSVLTEAVDDAVAAAGRE